ncbi:TetR/AcrR family transcriptional regulator [Streptomyces sp. NBC_00257]|uniref:TetR/AcrR family transcriptional regulator n=1 Tax=Streptomyces TaxID=1883 RepID=UPI002252B749|nr:MULTISPECIES: TetR/AcrR family transcriptional regulator [unclassified Streptomyces]WSW09507.1 TetR/AcrR family transcriptional regulator [Streptomyces sp. NBC_01005]WTB52528.1 TetR/AcrR family transcriptional regulator [Streptomyces sp. NBC_00826]WTC99012.1 TetR/AcrR family transcriptional regulator [Streptomyces sp. NBC_01650]WTH94580.1 TetR/AcrR family transcriptional regulator [Streptomyces sp. NBC_00825]WTI03315.1 TetR/AcrR family transcriptional regulator [Streptomyces sp. NBC_00822]
MSTVRGARERARIEVTAAIKDEAKKQLAAEGAAKLSLRAVARELGMASSAVYRYFPSRDELLTALIVDAYDSVGAAAEAAHRAAAAGPAGHLARWIAVTRAVRDWALAHPHEYALIYGSPVPGYSAPQATIGPASRVGLVLMAVVADAHRTDGLALPPLADDLRAEAARMVTEFAPDLPPEAAPPLIAAWAQLFGLISFEIFGQFHRVVEVREAFFREAVTEMARTVGLPAGENG